MNHIKYMAARMLKGETIKLDMNDYISERNVSKKGISIKESEILDRFATILDAKRGQFFISVYQRDYQTNDLQYEKILTDSLMTASEFLNQFAYEQKPIWLLGDGLVYYKDKFESKNTFFLDRKYWSPRACKVHFLGWKKAQQKQFTDPVSLKPLYLCRPEIKVKIPVTT